MLRMVAERPTEICARHPVRDSHIGPQISPDDLCLGGVGVFGDSSSVAIVVVEESSHPLAALNHSRIVEMAWFRADQSVAYALMVAFSMVVDDEALNGRP